MISGRLRGLKGGSLSGTFCGGGRTNDFNDLFTQHIYPRGRVIESSIKWNKSSLQKHRVGYSGNVHQYTKQMRHARHSWRVEF
jgi:hypothetical protein